MHLSYVSDNMHLSIKLNLQCLLRLAVCYKPTNTNTCIIELSQQFLQSQQNIYKINIVLIYICVVLLRVVQITHLKAVNFHHGLLIIIIVHTLKKKCITVGDH